MKIEEIHIVGFGKWTDVTFRFSNDFQIIAGPNEAGKTSLKAFIIGVFFGFPRGRRADQQLYEPRSGARYGGRVTIATQKGRFTIERLDRTQSMLTVRSLDSGLTMPDPEKWLQRLFAPLTEKDYRHIFSFDEAELDQVTNLTGDDFEQALLTYAKPQTQQFLSWADQHHQLGQQQFAQGKNGK
nr:AAA family ATPase [Serratia marcescens]